MQALNHSGPSDFLHRSSPKFFDRRPLAKWISHHAEHTPIVRGKIRQLDHELKRLELRVYFKKPDNNLYEYAISKIMRTTDGQFLPLDKPGSPTTTLIEDPVDIVRSWETSRDFLWCVRDIFVFTTNATPTNTWESLDRNLAEEATLLLIEFRDNTEDILRLLKRLDGSETRQPADPIDQEPGVEQVLEKVYAMCKTS